MLSDKKIKEKLAAISNTKDIVLILSPEENYQEINLAVLDKLVNKFNLFGLYVTLNKPYDTMVTILESKGISVKKMFFIDCITKTVGSKPTAENCYYLDNPGDLTSLSIGLSQLVERINGEKFLFLDSLSTLLLYNSAGTITRFAHFLTARMRQWKLTGIMISLEAETDKEMVSHLTQFVDKVIKF